MQVCSSQQCTSLQGDGDMEDLVCMRIGVKEKSLYLPWNSMCAWGSLCGGQGSVCGVISPLLPLCGSWWWDSVTATLRSVKYSIFNTYSKGSCLEIVNIPWKKTYICVWSLKEISGGHTFIWSETHSFPVNILESSLKMSGIVWGKSQMLEEGLKQEWNRHRQPNKQLEENKDNIDIRWKPKSTSFTSLETQGKILIYCMMTTCCIPVILKEDLVETA